MLPKAESALLAPRATNESGKSTLSFVGKAKIKEKEPVEEAAVIKLSDAAQQQQITPIKTAIGDAKTFIATAQAAAAAIDATLAEAQRNLESIAKTNNPRQKEALAEEAETLIAEITTIASAAKFNERSVINAGETTFIAEVDPSSATNNATQAVSVNNIALSTSDLRLSSSNNSTTILNDPSASLAEVEAARLAVNDVTTELNAKTDEINTLTSEIDRQISAATLAAVELNQSAKISNQEVRNEIAERATPLLEQRASAELTTAKTLLNLQA